MSVDAEQSLDQPKNGLSGNKNPTTWASHPIDIRLSVPFLKTRFYLTVVAGRERRKPQRRQEDRQSYPLLTFGNAFFALGIATLFSLTAMAILIARSSIIE